MTAVAAGRSPWLRAAEVIAAAAVYFLVARASLHFASLNASATPVWPPTGLAIGILLIRGKSMLPAIFAGAFAANFLTTPLLPAAAGIAVGNTLEAWVAAALISRWADGERVFHTPSGVARFAAIVIAVAAPVSATIGVSVLALTGFASWNDAAPVWTTWWLGDLAGAILVAPALVLWSRSFEGRDTASFGLPQVLAFAGAAAIGLLAFSPLSSSLPGVSNALAFLAILPLMWAALRLGLRDTATTALIVSSFAIWGVLAGRSPFSEDTLNDSLLLLAAFIVSVTLPALALAADRREAQFMLARTREELVHSQKLEALGQLTGTVAHDFNNVLTAIAGGLRLLAKQDQERAATMTAVNEALERGASLARQLLSFSRTQPLELEVLKLDEVLERARKLIEQAVGEGVALEMRVAQGVWPVRAERAQLELALLNLALNGRDAMPNGGTLRISAENSMEGEARTVAISVEDTGHGMSDEVRARVFEPFFTTKGREAGTGLGLAQVYNFARHAQGDVAIDSAVGKGTIVTITLPRA